jgi:hypothetical protein
VFNVVGSTKTKYSHNKIQSKKPGGGVTVLLSQRLGLNEINQPGAAASSREHFLRREERFVATVPSSEVRPSQGKK